MILHEYFGSKSWPTLFKHLIDDRNGDNLRFRRMIEKDDEYVSYVSYRSNFCSI